MLSNLSTYFDIYDFLNKNTTISKNLILEPRCCIFKIILLNYKSSGTKISINNNAITFNEPSYIQGILRYYMGDSRNDLHNIHNPLIKAMELSDLNNEINIYFFKKCIDGFNLLKEVYDKNTIIHHTINHYVNIITKFIENNEIEKINKDLESPLIDGLKNIWKTDEIDLIYNMLIYIDKLENSSEKRIYIKNVEDLLLFKEKKVNEYILKNSTTYN